VATAPSTQDLVQAGVWWINRDWNDYSNTDDEIDYSDNVYFTRLHVRYNRNSFPQDLQFQLTPNTENFQARYIITHPAQGDFDCEAGKKYLKELKKRRQNELEILASLTGKGYDDWDVVTTELKEDIPAVASYKVISAQPQQRNDESLVVIGALGVIGLIGVAVFRRS
jgi:hypothetical protein